MTETPLFGDGYWDTSLEVADALRAEATAHRATLPNQIRVWVIGHYAHARAALADPRLSKDIGGLTAIIRGQLAETGQADALSNMFSPHMLFNDDPAHARLRGLLTAKFTRARVQALKPRVEQLTDTLLEVLPRDRPIDLIDRVAFPLPLTVICELLGIPTEERGPLRDWTAALMEDLPERTLPASRAMEQYFTELIAAKRTTPGDDLLSALIQVAGDEDRLAPGELMGTLFLLFVAGHETSTNMIGNSVRWLLQDPQRWRLLGQRPELVPGAVEELLRFDSPVRMATHRFTTEPVDVGGVLIPAGELVLVSLQSANRDSARFPGGDQLDLHRDASGHLSFGHGIHYCLGAPLGRMEAELALGGLTRRFPGARLAVDEADLKRRHSAIMNGYVDLPLLLGR
ncbi:cytochrome P450 (plasmid) [Lentzea sp. JNUCC 0626]|uniref:cytochrome P450 family protein n=1 Tax=Lentzea sp. JNUCC 0626 TaxID=3367513 RepID=UPI003749D3A7